MQHLRAAQDLPILIQGRDAEIRRHRVCNRKGDLEPRLPLTVDARVPPLTRTLPIGALEHPPRDLRGAMPARVDAAVGGPQEDGRGRHGAPHPARALVRPVRRHHAEGGDGPRRQVHVADHGAARVELREHRQEPVADQHPARVRQRLRRPLRLREPRPLRVRVLLRQPGRHRRKVQLHEHAAAVGADVVVAFALAVVEEG